MVLTATLQCDIVAVMDDKFSYEHTNQFNKCVVPIAFYICTCSNGILLSYRDSFFAKTLRRGKWIPASAGVTVWRKN
jgi:hypothetical protein